MDRDDKINILIEYLDEENIKIIETKSIQGLIIDAEVPERDIRESLVDKGLNDEDVDKLVEFQNNNMFIVVRVDEVSGVSFDNCELSSDLLYDTDLWKDGDD